MLSLNGGAILFLLGSAERFDGETLFRALVHLSVGLTVTVLGALGSICLIISAGAAYARKRLESDFTRSLLSDVMGLKSNKRIGLVGLAAFFSVMGLSEFVAGSLIAATAFRGFGCAGDASCAAPIAPVLPPQVAKPALSNSPASRTESTAAAE